MNEHRIQINRRATGYLHLDGAVIGTITDWAGIDFSKPDDSPLALDDQLVARYAAARTFLEAMGMADPSPDAVDQLLDAFVPSLRIMCDRGYDPEGATWRASGWRGQIQEIRKKTDRLWLRGWLRGKFDPDSARDIINYAGFYLRLGGQGKPWGIWGEPGSESEE